MKVRIEKSFDRDVNNIRDKRLLRKLRDTISLIEDSKSIHEIPHGKKIQGYASFYRIKIGDYRLGLEVVSSDEVVLMRLLHRREIYRYFPQK